MTKIILKVLSSGCIKMRSRQEDANTVVIEAMCSDEHDCKVLPDAMSAVGQLAPEALRIKSTGCAAVHPQGRFQQYLDEARTHPPVRVAVVHPCSEEAIIAAVEAFQEGLLEPILVGPEHKIRMMADKAGISLAGMAIEAVEHSHAAAERGVELVANGKASALMKGSLHTDELLGAVVAAGSGLRTERRISHVYVLDTPAYPKPLIVTDAAINIAPSLDHKRDIIQNAVDFLHILGVADPLVAVLAAVETINSAMPATLDAAALTVMAARGQISGAKVDGPLAFDILKALQTYGMILADNGSSWFISGAPDVRWNDEELHDELLRVTGADFEAVDMSGLKTNGDSAAAGK